MADKQNSTKIILAIDNLEYEDWIIKALNVLEGLDYEIEVLKVSKEEGKLEILKQVDLYQ